jgi:hypothetical protein
VGITGRMLLRLEKSIKVPEAGLYETIGRHFLETHFEENFSELLSNFHQRVKSTARWCNTNSIKVVFLECGIFPFTTVEMR